jgi:hypothetical protein
VSRGGRNREAVPKRNRDLCLQARDLDHPGGPWKVQRECSPQIRSVSSAAARPWSRATLRSHSVL